MIKYLMLALVCIGRIEASAQQPNEKRDKRIRWGVLYSASVSYRTLNLAAKETSINEWRNNNEQPKYGHWIGALMQKPLGNKTALELGFWFSEWGYKTNTVQLTWNSNTSNGMLPNRAMFKYSYSHLGISARYRYQVFGDKIKYYLMPGIAWGALLNRKTTVLARYASGKKDASVSSVRAGFAETAVIPSVAFGGLYQISNSLSVCVEPVFRFQLNSLLPGENNKEKLYAYGINLLILYNKK